MWEWSYLIPVVAIVMGIGCGMWAIYWDHKKEMALIEKGLYQPRPQTKKPSLTPGLIVTGVGLALIIGKVWLDLLWGVGFAGLISTFVGIALIVAYFATREKKAIS